MPTELMGHIVFSIKLSIFFVLPTYCLRLSEQRNFASKIGCLLMPTELMGHIVFSIKLSIFFCSPYLLSPTK